jgi:hypothetical protein
LVGIAALSSTSKKCGHAGTGEMILHHSTLKNAATVIAQTHLDREDEIMRAN